MEKKRSPIADWRQVMRPGPKSRSVPLSRGKVVPRPPVVPLERSAKERWEDEGGHVKPALPKPPIVGGE
jgi:hypothetical protein